MRHIDEIIIHCSATRPDWNADLGGLSKVAEIRRWHVEDNGWSDIGYHYVIDRNGKVFEGRPEARSGAHTLGHNENSIGICLIGGFGSSETDRFEDNYTSEQDRALRALIADLKLRRGAGKISGHNQYAAKACPGFNVHRWVKQAQPRSTPAQSKTVQSSVVQGATAIGGAVGALNSLDGVAQIIALVGCFVIGALAMFILRERLKKWAAGIK